MSSEEKCQHLDWDDYFERCPDCGLTPDNMTAEQLKEYNEFLED